MNVGAAVNTAKTWTTYGDEVSKMSESGEINNKISDSAGEPTEVPAKQAIADSDSEVEA